MSVNCSTLLAKPVVRGKLCFGDFRRVKNDTSNLRRALIFSCEKDAS